MDNREFVRTVTTKIFSVSKDYYSNSDAQWTEEWVKTRLKAYLYQGSIRTSDYMRILGPYLGSPIRVSEFSQEIKEALDTLFQDIYDEIYECMMGEFGEPDDSSADDAPSEDIEDIEDEIDRKAELMAYGRL